jgi:hypothetical protein
MKGCNRYFFSGFARGYYLTSSPSGTYNGTVGLYCGATFDDALTNVQYHIPLFSACKVFYVMSNPSQYTFALPTSAYGVEQVVFLTLGAVSIVLAVTIYLLALSFHFCDNR